MRFNDIPIGTFFRFDYQGLPARLARAEGLGPFRKVAEDGAVDIADGREITRYVPSATKVRVLPDDGQEHQGTGGPHPGGGARGGSPGPRARQEAPPRRGSIPPEGSGGPGAAVRDDFRPISRLISIKEGHMRKDLRIVLLVPAALILATGCATRDWVRGYWGEQETAINQRFDKVEGQVAQDGQQIQGMGVRVQGVEGSVKEVGDVAKGAQGRADAAYGRADEVNGRLTRLWANRRVRNEVETIHLQFGFDRWELNDTAQTSLQSMVKELRENPKLTVDLQGYTDSVGKRTYNLQLSQRRVETVRRYLVEQGVELPRINLIGLGPLPDNGNRGERAKNRRVTVKLMVDAE